MESLRGAANLADFYFKKHGGSPHLPYEEWLNDGYAVHAPVGSFSANPFGLHDVHGNVFEWCQDCYGEYPAGSVTDPQGPASGEHRVLRGGSWNNNQDNARCANRNRNNPNNRNNNIGFRCARSISTGKLSSASAGPECRPPTGGGP